MATAPSSTQIIAPRVQIVDPRTGIISHEWYRFLYNLYEISGTGTGVIPVNRGGTGLSTIPTDGQLLIGNGAGYTLSGLGAGAGIVVNVGPGAISIVNDGVLSFSAGTTGLTPNTDTTGVVTLGGVLNVANGGTGQGSYTDGQLLIGNSTGNTLTKNTLTAGAGIAISNGPGAVTIATSGISVTSAPVTKTADFTVAAGETWLINNKSGSTCTVTLPAPSALAGRTLHFQNYQDQLLVSASSNVVPLAGGAASTALLDDVAGAHATLVSDGTNWVMTQYGSNNALLLE